MKRGQIAPLSIILTVAAGAIAGAIVSEHAANKVESNVKDLSLIHI